MLAPIISAALIGLMASGGPCTAARAIAGSAFYSGPRRVFSLATFTFGAFLTDLALVSSLGLFFRALEISAFCYGVAAIAAYRHVGITHAPAIAGNLNTPGARW
jgi:hypothetical protein